MDPNNSNPLNPNPNPVPQPEPQQPQPVEQSTPVQEPVLQQPQTTTPQPPMESLNQTIPTASPVPPAVPTPAPTASPDAPKGKGRKAIILLVILLLLVIGMAAYVLFAKNKIDNAQKEATNNSSVAIPTPTAIPTLAPEDDLTVDSPETDLQDIEKDLQGL